MIAEYFFENGITPPQNVASARLSDITYINDLKGSQISRKDLDLYAEAFRTVEVYGELGFLRL